MNLQHPDPTVPMPLQNPITDQLAQQAGPMCLEGSPGRETWLKNLHRLVAQTQPFYLQMALWNNQVPCVTEAQIAYQKGVMASRAGQPQFTAQQATWGSTSFPEKVMA